MNWNNNTIKLLAMHLNYKCDGKMREYGASVILHECLLQHGPIAKATVEKWMRRNGKYRPGLYWTEKLKMIAKESGFSK